MLAYGMFDRIVLVATVWSLGKTLWKSDMGHLSADFNINVATFCRKPREKTAYGLFSCTDNTTSYHIDTYENATVFCEDKNSKIYTPKICDNNFERNELERKMMYNFYNKLLIRKVWTGVKRTGYNGKD